MAQIQSLPLEILYTVGEERKRERKEGRKERKRGERRKEEGGRKGRKEGRERKKENEKERKERQKKGIFGNQRKERRDSLHFCSFYPSVFGAAHHRP